MRIYTGLTTLMLLGGSLLAGCASSPTEEAFGDAVRATLAQQRVPPAPATDQEPTMDGVRLESVLEVYRTFVGDPLPVVRERVVETE